MKRRALLFVLPAFLAARLFLPNSHPFAVIVADRIEGPVPLTVQSDGTDSYDPDGTIRQYRWGPGDGEEGTGDRAHVLDPRNLRGDSDGDRQAAGPRDGLRHDRCPGGAKVLPVAAFTISQPPAYPRQTLKPPGPHSFGVWLLEG